MRLSVGLAVVALLSTLLAAPAEAQYSRAGLEGKSLAQFGYGFVSGATDWFVSILYRVVPQWDIAAGFESLTATGGSASSFTFGGRYHFLSEPEKFDPYLFGGLGSISVAVTGLGTASATGVSFGVGSNVTLSDAAEGFGNIGVVSIAAPRRLYMALASDTTSEE